MRILVTSQNFRQVTGHAGRARRFLVFQVNGAAVHQVGQLDLAQELALHGFDDRMSHPLDDADVLITGGCGDGFAERMARRGVRVVATAESDPETAVHAFLAGCLKSPPPPGHAHKSSHSCSCGR